MTIKDLRSDTVTISVREFSRILALASDHAKVSERLKIAEAKIQRMRKQLTEYQRICERDGVAEANKIGGVQ